MRAPERGQRYYRYVCDEHLWVGVTGDFAFSVRSQTCVCVLCRMGGGKQGGRNLRFCKRRENPGERKTWCLPRTQRVPLAAPHVQSCTWPHTRHQVGGERQAARDPCSPNKRDLHLQRPLPEQLYKKKYLLIFVYFLRRSRVPEATSLKWLVRKQLTEALGVEESAWPAPGVSAGEGCNFVKML